MHRNRRGRLKHHTAAAAVVALWKLHVYKQLHSIFCSDNILLLAQNAWILNSKFILESAA